MAYGHSTTLMAFSFMFLQALHGEPRFGCTSCRAPRFCDRSTGLTAYGFMFSMDFMVKSVLAVRRAVSCERGEPPMNADERG